MLIIEGSEHSDRLVVVAPGDLGLVTDPGPLRLATSMIAAGYRVIRFAAPRPLIEDAMAADRALADVIRQASEEASPGQGLVLVGFSRGARVAAALTAELNAVGLIAFAYPFHGRTEPNTNGRIETLAQVPVPVLLCQGTRDSHGNLEQIRGYGLPPHVETHWLRDANHDLVPRAKSGCTQQELLELASLAAVRFVAKLPRP